MPRQSNQAAAELAYSCGHCIASKICMRYQSCTSKTYGIERQAFELAALKQDRVHDAARAFLDMPAPERTKSRLRALAKRAGATVTELNSEIWTIRLQGYVS